MTKQHFDSKDQLHFKAGPAGTGFRLLLLIDPSDIHVTGLEFVPRVNHKDRCPYR